MRKCVVVYNPESGRKNWFIKDNIDKMNTILSNHGYSPEFYKSKYGTKNKKKISLIN